MAERYGFLKPSVDAHVLGITCVGELITDCGGEVVNAPAAVCRACDHPEAAAESALIESWLREVALPTSAIPPRLSPDDGVALFARLVRQLSGDPCSRTREDRSKPLFCGASACLSARAGTCSPRCRGVRRGGDAPGNACSPGPVEAANPPRIGASHLIRQRPFRVRRGNRQTGGILRLLGTEPPVYPAFGTANETVTTSLADPARRGGLPLYRAHMGAYLPDRAAAVQLFCAGRGSWRNSAISTSCQSAGRSFRSNSLARNGATAPTAEVSR